MVLANKELVVKLNKHWQAFEIMTVGDAVTFLCSLSGGEHPGYAIDYETVTDSNGLVSLVYANPVPIAEWMKLPVRPQDLAIGIGYDRETNQIRYMRVPMVVICAKYDELPLTRVRWSPAAVRERDKGICQVTKRKLRPDEGNVGHDHAQSKHPERRRDWTNTIWMDKKLNTIQGTRTFSEMGWHVAKPKAPKTHVKMLRAEQAKHPSQIPFLI